MITGIELSLILIICTQLLCRTVLEGAVAVHVLDISIEPVQAPVGFAFTSTKLTAGAEQLASPATAVAIPVLKGCVLLPAQASKVGGQVITGTALQAQLTVTLKLAEVVCPQASTAV